MRQSEATKFEMESSDWLRINELGIRMAFKNSIMSRSKMQQV